MADKEKDKDAAAQQAEREEKRIHQYIEKREGPITVSDTDKPPPRRRDDEQA